MEFLLLFSTAGCKSPGEEMVLRPSGAEPHACNTVSALNLVPHNQKIVPFNTPSMGFLATHYVSPFCIGLYQKRHDFAYFSVKYSITFITMILSVNIKFLVYMGNKRYWDCFKQTLSMVKLTYSSMD